MHFFLFLVLLSNWPNQYTQVTHIYDLANNTDTIIIVIKNSNKIIFKNILIENFYKLSKKKKTKKKSKEMPVCQAVMIFCQQYSWEFLLVLSISLWSFI